MPVKSRSNPVLSNAWKVHSVKSDLAGSDPLGLAPLAPGQTRLILIRHGETAWNRSRTIQGQRDIPLNETGLAQAEAAAQYLRGLRIDAIHASDLARAHQTAEIIARPHRLAVNGEPGLRERHWGRFQGLRFDEIAGLAPEAHARMLARDPGYVLEGGGESLEALGARVAAAMGRLVGGRAGQTIIAVAHGGVLDAVHRLAARMPLDTARSFALPNAAINVVDGDGEHWQIRDWARVNHLEGLARYDELSER